MSGYCDVPWMGQDSSKSKGEGKLVPVNAMMTHGEGTLAADGGTFERHGPTDLPTAYVERENKDIG